MTIVTMHSILFSYFEVSGSRLFFEGSCFSALEHRRKMKPLGEDGALIERVWLYSSGLQNIGLAIQGI